MLLAVAAPLLPAQQPGSNQELQFASAARGPAFYYAPSPLAVGERRDARSAAVLHRRVSLEVRSAPLADVISEIARQSGLHMLYSPELIPTTSRVTVDAKGLTVAAALTEVLIDAGLDIELTGANDAVLVRRGTPSTAAGMNARSQGTSAIAGHVTDAGLKTALAQVAVRVEGTALSTISAADGKYAIRGVPPGSYRVTARRVGYQPLTKEITVVEAQTATIDFPLAAAPTRLDEVVTTALGQQRRYEVGNDISTINVDSIAPTAPVTSLTDLISARAPGVSVLETGGMTGSGEAIRIEGLTSLVLQNDPILIVDGVRQDNGAGGDLSAILFQFNGTTHPTPTRLNDIDFSDIATIDILKGPAASTEYGTDAANGVIVITTKHGQVGAPQWRASAEQTESAIPVTFPAEYYSWGHTTDGTRATTNCALNGTFLGFAATTGACVLDSVTSENPLNDASRSIFGTGSRGKYDLSVGGGSDAVRYYVAGGLTNETGIIRMPPVFRELADTADLGLPSTAFRPNGEQQRSVRLNTAIRLGSTADLTATASYLSTFQQTPNAQILYTASFFAPALDDAAHDYGYNFLAFSAGRTPLAVLSELGSQNTNRVTGGLTANWHPTSWFAGHATAGLDHGSEVDHELVYPLADPTFEFSPPVVGVANNTTDIYSVDVRGTATTDITRGIRSATSAGFQLVDMRIAGQAAQANNITATNLTLNGAVDPTVTQLGTRQATLGGYGEEQVSIMDRLFLTGALRIDAASGFGTAYNVAAYPKASASWLLMNGSATTLRLRGAFGESGVQPLNGAADRLYAAAVVFAGGVPATAQALNWPGNPDLAPERTAEFEGGLDLGGWGNRVSVALTGYTKTTHDALVNENLGVTLNNYGFQENIGEVRNTGAEANVTATVIEKRSVTWTVGVNASINHNTLLSLAPGVAAQTVVGNFATYRQAPGYPLYGLWSSPVSYRDANRDGILEPSEITVGDSLQYIGPSLPTREASVTTHVGLWHGAVSFGALLDYRGGFRIANATGIVGDLMGNTRGRNYPAAPWWLQARGIQNLSGSAQEDEDGSYVRFRELSVTYVVPHSVLRALRMQTVSVTGAVRNLALWTRYTGVDPEVVNSAGDNVQYQPSANGYQLNNDVRGDEGSVPLPRYWVVRLNVGF